MNCLCSIVHELFRFTAPKLLTDFCTQHFTCASDWSSKKCEEIKDFVTELSLRQHWWNNGISVHSLWTGSFLARCDIPRRVGLIKMSAWREKIHAMLRRIPSEIPLNDIDNSDDAGYFDSISSKLANYEYVQDVVPLLELALWKTKMIGLSNGNFISDDLRSECRRDSILMLVIIFPNVHSFLVGE